MSRYEWPPPGRKGRRDRALRRAAWRSRLLDAVPPELIEKAVETRAAREAARPRVRMAPGPDVDLWLPVGPTSTVRGQAGSRPRIAGRVRDLRVSPDGARAYAATANGGVWFSDDAGTTWHPLGGWATTSNASAIPHPANILVCGALHVTFGSASDGSEDVVHVATGELRPDRVAHPGMSNGGIGILHLAVPVTDALADPFMNPWRREANNLTGAGVYRITRDPASPDRLVAATSIGLFMRDGAFVEDADWQRIAVPPFDFDADDGPFTTDVVWTPADGATPSRLWVALVNPNVAPGGTRGTALYVSENGAGGPFDPVPLNGIRNEDRIGLAVAPSDPSILYALGGTPRLWRIEGRNTRVVDRVPRQLFGDADNDQSWYDLAVAVHPTDPNMVALGGSTVFADGDWSASLFRCTITCTASGCRTDFRPANNGREARDATFVGSDIHPDVHALCWIEGNGSPQLWVGCDGGVFRSLSNGDRYSFVARNNGLAVVEPGYVACHPTSDGLILAGTQDNGTIRRIGTSVWEVVLLGDGGGTAFHPTKPHGFVAQYTNADWNSLHTFAPPVLRDQHEQAEERENGAALFYSGCAVMPGEGDNARLVIGTNRVWLSETWNPDARSRRTMRWVTLPTATDPRANGRGNTTRDTFPGNGDHVIACRFIDENRILVLCLRHLFLFRRNPADGSWRREDLGNSAAALPGTNEDIPETSAPFLPRLGQWSDIAVHDPARGDHGSCYVSTTGHVMVQDDTIVEFDRMDTLWWFDGTDTWFQTGLRNDANGAEAPAFAVVCDPDDADVVYVGTAIGVFRGRLTFTDGAPSWSWTYLANGLPEAVVHDLAFFNHGGVKLLRAAVQARGVWELDLSSPPASTRRTYLRAHPYDMRRITPAVLDDPVQGRGATYPWNRSPDLVCRRSQPPARPRSLPWRNRAPDEFDLWVFQTALHSQQPLVIPNGRWTPGFGAALRAFRVANGRSNQAVVDGSLWDLVVTDDNFGNPWGDDEPTEADLHELIVERREAAGAGEYVLTTPGRHEVHVCVHHAHTRPLAAADVSVVVLRRPLAAAEHADAGADVVLSDAWRDAVIDQLAGTDTPLPDGWERIAPVVHPPGPVDARTSRVVSLELDLSDAERDDRFLLVAIVSAIADPATAAGLQGGTVRELVLGSRHAVARSIRVT